MQALDPGTRQAAAELRLRFEQARPFRHWISDRFFAPDFAQRLLREFPPFERGNALNEDGRPGGKSVVEKIRALGPTFSELDDLVKSPRFLEWLGQASGIAGLRYDPHYFGGGTHENRHGQDLDPHVDFNRHPIDASHRRLNLIVYLNPEWREEWGGALELHSDPRSDDDRIETVLPLFNRAVLFETTEWSWHGFRRIDLPESRRDLARRSIALYFYTAERPAEELASPHSTIYVDRPLPPRFAPGRTLDTADVGELQALIQRRDQHNQRLYRELTELQTRVAAYERAAKETHLQRLAEGIGQLRRAQREGGRVGAEEFRRAMLPFVVGLPHWVHRPLGRLWRLARGRAASGGAVAVAASRDDAAPARPPLACPVCPATAAAPEWLGEVAPTHDAAFSVSRFSLVHCPGCDVVRLHPLPTAQDLETLYQGSEQFTDEHYTAADRVEAMLGYYGDCLDRFSLLPAAGGRCLEVGAGYAWVSRACKQRDPGVHTVAQDVTRECAERCSWVDHYLVGPLESVPREPGFELISLTHVIEHVPHPERMLAELAARLAPGGRLFITAPYRPAGWAPGDGIGPWRDYSYLHVPAHISYLSEQWFRSVAARCGLSLQHWDATQDGQQAFEAILAR
jgi:SAM-dependent methyltransferase